MPARRHISPILKGPELSDYSNPVDIYVHSLINEYGLSPQGLLLIRADLLEAFTESKIDEIIPTQYKSGYTDFYNKYCPVCYK